MSERRRVLVFDSGVGGLSVLDAIVRRGGALSLDYAADTAWLPYGDKSDAALRARVPALLRAVAHEWAPEAIVLACNTASTVALDDVRLAVDVPVIGVVPPVKPAAALSASRVIGLLATPATIARPYTEDLIARFAGDCRVIRYGTTALVAEAEAKLSGRAVDPSKIDEAIDGLFSAEGGDRMDVVAMACTHFPLLLDELKARAPRAVRWLDSGDAVAARLHAVLGLVATDGLDPRLRRAGFTAPPGERWQAFEARGFSARATVGSARGFHVAPAADSFG